MFSKVFDTMEGLKKRKSSQLQIYGKVHSITDIIFTGLIFSLDSGEKTTKKEWPMLLEIKGRVR
ncbi:unnamed protein product [Brassica oleracea var. botrytis]|uniref:Uncharacterized protein n=2 Tax=Brassica TaxID=3705 RepID=A0A3P6BRZ6_BRAOL|nr:unnamed protein product [Brassica napus]VDD08887.1 unnamed protein product [Brassica oleracea]